MTVVNIRGTNGSGKSTIAHRMIAELGGVPILNNGFMPDKRDDLIIGYQCAENIRIVGRYNVKCGGADTFHTREVAGIKVKGVDDVERLIELWACEGSHVVFEGLIVSNTTRWRGLSRRLGNFVWAYLDTPVEVCRARTAERNGGKVLKEEDHLLRVWNSCHANAAKIQQEGECIVWLDHTRAYEQVLELLRSGSTPARPTSPISQKDSSPREPTELLQVF